MIRGIVSPGNADRSPLGVGYGMQFGVHATFDVPDLARALLTSRLEPMALCL